MTNTVAIDSAKDIVGGFNIAIGPRAGHKLLTATGCILIGEDAGADLIDQEGVVIIGDGIRSLDPEQEGVLFIGGGMPDRGLAIGETVMGQPCNLKAIIEGKMEAWRLRDSRTGEPLKALSHWPPS